jgi:hypothetical protein
MRYKNPTKICKCNETTYGYTVKKRFNDFSPARMSLTKLSLTGKNSIIPGHGEFG